tara:strand:+ start:4229 stop:4852 length:624 start_codon:yes stop_codon:yes gene_type:complete
MNRLSPIVKQLLIINIIFYFGTQNLLSIKYAMSLNFPEYSSFAVWQIFTHMFMHGNIQHLLFNMFALWMFGSSVEYMLGSKKFLFFYISSGFGAAIIQIISNYYNYFFFMEQIPIMLGASGAIMGVLVAFGMFFPQRKLMLIFLPIPIKAKYFIPGIIFLDLFSAITGTAIFSPSNTAFVAHLGGALTGFLVMYYWKRNQFNKNRWF